MNRHKANSTTGDGLDMRARAGRVLLALSLVLAANMVVQLRSAARACSCADQQPKTPTRSQFDSYDAVFTGIVLDPYARPFANFKASSVRVKPLKVFKGDLDAEVTVRVQSSSCGSGLPMEDPGLYWLKRQDDELVTVPSCALSGLNQLRALTGDLPGVNGTGPLRALVSLDLGDITMAALDGHGAVLGYALSAAPPQALAACPGGKRALAFGPSADGATRSAVDVIDLASMRVVSTHVLRREVVGAVVRFECTDPAGEQYLLTAATTQPETVQLLAVDGQTEDELTLGGRAFRSNVVGATLIVSGSTVREAARVGAHWLTSVPIDVAANMPSIGLAAISPDHSKLALLGSSTPDKNREPAYPARRTVADDRLVVVQWDTTTVIRALNLEPRWGATSLRWQTPDLEIAWNDPAGNRQIVHEDGSVEPPVRSPKADPVQLDGMTDPSSVLRAAGIPSVAAQSMAAGGFARPDGGLGVALIVADGPKVDPVAARPRGPFEATPPGTIRERGRPIRPPIAYVSASFVVAVVVILLVVRRRRASHHR